MSGIVLERRSLLLGAGAALMIGGISSGQAARLGGAASPLPQSGQSAITAWVRIGTDNRVTIIASQAELGQGISTTLPAVLADELGADWRSVDVESAPFDIAYRNPRANWMFTGNSESVQSFLELMRTMGAAAREMLVLAAAQRWKVPPEQCRTDASRVLHSTSRRALTFGELAADAARLPVPQPPKLKQKSELRLVGRSLPRIDVPAKVDGSAVFGLDFKVPGMLSAAIRTAPTIGGTLRSVDEGAIKSRAGIRTIVRLQNGVAIVADKYHQARSALIAHAPVFEVGPNASISSATVAAAYREILDQHPAIAAKLFGNLLREMASRIRDNHIELREAVS